MLHCVTFANEQMMANFSRQHLPFTPSKLSQKCGGWYVVDRAIINKNRQAGNIPCGLAVHPTNMLLFFFLNYGIVLFIYLYAGWN